MVYLIDACVLIQAKNSHYAFDLCPGFWDWLAARNLEGVVYSVDKVSEELKAKTDELSQRAADQGANFFLKVDQQTESALHSVIRWANSSHYGQAYIAEFCRGADYYLVAHALAHQCTVVTAAARARG